MKETIDFAFNMPIKTKTFEENPLSAVNNSIPTIAKREKSPLEILEERFARGEISDIEYQNKIRLLKLAKDHLKDKPKEKQEEKIGIQVRYKNPDKNTITLKNLSKKAVGFAGFN